MGKLTGPHSGQGTIMKRILLFAALLLVSAANSFGQGTVVFQNTASPAFNVTTNNGSGFGPISGANGYRIGLYASVNTNATAGSLALVGLATNVNGLPGKFNGGGGFVLPNGFPTGTPIVFQLRGWSFAGGTSYEEALSAAASDPLNIVLGTSPLGSTVPGGGTVLAGALFGTSPGLLSSGFVIGVPEPSSIALGLLGLGAIALFRRRK